VPAALAIGPPAITRKTGGADIPVNPACLRFDSQRQKVAGLLCSSNRDGKGEKPLFGEADSNSQLKELDLSPYCARVKLVVPSLGPVVLTSFLAPSWCHFPQPDGIVGSTRGQILAARIKCQGKRLSRMAFKEGGGLPACNIP